MPYYVKCHRLQGRLRAPFIPPALLPLHLPDFAVFFSKILENFAFNASWGNRGGQHQIFSLTKSWVLEATDILQPGTMLLSWYLLAKFQVNCNSFLEHVQSILSWYSISHLGPCRPNMVLTSCTDPLGTWAQGQTELKHSWNISV